MKPTSNTSKQATSDVAKGSKGRANQVRKQASKVTGNNKHKNTTISSNVPQEAMMQSLPIPSTPTSLANLAQLNGITLLPVSGIKSATTTTTTNTGGGSFNQSRSIDLFAASSVASVSTKNAITTPPKRSATGSARAQKQSKSSTVNNNFKPQSRISNIQSIQSLAQQITGSSDYNWSCTDTSDDGIFNVQQSSQSTLPLVSQKTKTSRVNVKKNKQTSNNDSSTTTNYIPVIPVTEGLPIFADLKDIQSVQSNIKLEGMLLQPDLNSLEQLNEDNNDDDDPNNISFIKLMAILNNPALTITAVGNSTSNNKNNLCNQDLKHPQVPVSAINIIDNEQLGIANLAHDTSDSNNNSNISYKSIATKEQSIRNRIPQSAANLQKFHNSSTTLKGHNLDLEGSTTTIKDNEHQLSWLSNYNSIEASNFPNETASWQDDFSGSSTSQSKDFYSNDKRNESSVLSTSVRNLMMQQASTDPKRSAVSVQLLKHIANQTKDNDWTLSQDQKSILEPECILSVNRNINQLNLGAKRIHRDEIVTLDNEPKKRFKQPVQTSKKRLYIPTSSNNINSCIDNDDDEQQPSDGDFKWSSIKVELGDPREVYVSERHSILESMASNENTTTSHKNIMPEPDEIFINRSKRIMSKIDTMIERKKRRKFERISSRSSPKMDSPELVNAESENEWSDDENKKHDFIEVIRTQLPLEEVVTREKREHFFSLGLVTRQEKNKLLIEQCERKSKIFSPLSVKNLEEVPDGIHRLIETMLKTNGVDVQLRVESNIKRNDLPLIEGLNRNTSRIKMNYMNVLGLDKRSKRTTLYKVKGTDHVNTTSLPKPNIDLIKVKTLKIDRQMVVETPAEPELNVLATNEWTAKSMKALPLKLNYSSCRDALRLPNKDEYMKSLGLMTPF